MAILAFFKYQIDILKFYTHKFKNNRKIIQIFKISNKNKCSS